MNNSHNSIDYRTDNTIIFTLARMNPPTPGHLFLIQKLIEQGIEKNVEKVYVILSKTNDNNENPISCTKKMIVLGEHSDTSKTMINSIKEKMKSETTDVHMKRKINDIIVENICVSEEKSSTLFTTIFSISNNYPESNDLNLFLIIGDDRKNMLDSLSDFFLKQERFNSVDGLILDRENMGDFKEKSSNKDTLSGMVMKNVPISAMSASFVRNIVKNNNKEKFIELYSPYLEEEKIDMLYQAIKKGLELPSPKKKSESSSNKLKYEYPVTKHEIDLNIKRKKNKELSPPKKSGKKTKKVLTPPKKGGKKIKKTNKRITKKYHLL
jgi:nicotinic acid mononucleotide adenylyltransferase